MRSVEIDLDVHKAIELGRREFGESDNAILRRLLKIDPDVPAVFPKPRTSRSSGAYSVVVGGVPIEANSLKELLQRVVLHLDGRMPGFIQALARRSTPRGRRIVASEPMALYPKSPQLLEFAGRLNDDWWYDTNVGRNQLQTYLRLFAELAQLSEIPRITKRSEKTTVTLADLGLA